MKHFSRSLLLLSLAFFLVGCQTRMSSEMDSFIRSFRKELPFKVDSISYSAQSDCVEFRFSNSEYVSTAPDCEIDLEGRAMVYRSTVLEPLTRQPENLVWRNVVVSRKHQRVICIDRYLRQGRTEGFVYVFQTETKKYPTYGTYHWDVSDSRHIEFMGTILDGMCRKACLRLKGDNNAMTVPPESQDDYWILIFHADSLYDGGFLDEARRVYDLAFTYDKYILPLHLSQVSDKMNAIGDEKTACRYLKHRTDMEKDFYMDPSECPFVSLKDTFALRQQKWGYDLQLKELLEEIFEQDQHSRILWSLSSARNPQDSGQIEMLALKAAETDCKNLAAINDILSRVGFPSKDRVGDFASQTTWLVFQHSDLEHQKKFLPQLEDAVANGCISPAYLAALKDRIEVCEGRPQKYGTQTDGKGCLCPLLDASHVNEWRQEVGLPPIDM